MKIRLFNCKYDFCLRVSYLLAMFVVGGNKTASSVWFSFKLVLTSSKLHKGQDLQSDCR